MAKNNDLPVIVKPNAISKNLKERFDQAKVQKSQIDDFFHEFLGNFLSEQTRRAYTRDLNSFFDFLKQGHQVILHPNDIQAHHFQVYRDFLIEQKYSPATINRKLVAIRSFMKWALAMKLVDTNPLDAVKLPKVATASPTVAFTDAEVIKMLNAVDRTTLKGSAHYLTLLMLFELGLRRSELANIRVGDFSEDRDHYVLTIRGKGDKTRLLPINKFLRREIDKYIDFLNNHLIEKIASDDYLIQTRGKKKNAKPIDGSTIYRIVEKYAVACGINKKVSPHSCRATVISHLLDTANATLRDVATFAGHTNITTTERYDKRRENLDKSVAYQVDYRKTS